MKYSILVRCDKHASTNETNEIDSSIASEVVNEARVLLNEPSDSTIAHVFHDSLARLEGPIPLFFPNQSTLAEASEFEQNSSVDIASRSEAFLDTPFAYLKSATACQVKDSEPLLRETITPLWPILQYQRVQYS